MRNLKFKTIRGFTFFEILIVASIFTMISVTLFSAFNNGLKLWSRSQQLHLEEDIAIFVDKIGRELRNTFSLGSLKFKGRRTRVDFPTIVRILVDRKITDGEVGYINQPGKISYEFNAEQKKLYKRQASYGRALDNDFNKEWIVFDNIHFVKFKYYYFNDRGDWIETEKIDQIPKVIRIYIEFNDDKGRVRGISRVIKIPATKIL